MSQNSYKEKIIDALLRSENHIRGLAKELNTNQMNISRKIKELYDENVVDYKLEGRNKVFSLKKTIEAKQYVYSVEAQKIIAAVKRYPKLRNIIESIKKRKDINLAVIFGSYAKGKATKESYIDLYIETTDRKIKEELSKINSKLSVKIGAYNKQSILIKEIEKNHLIIKGIEEYYEKAQFFE
ncbi:nucleotidyltransferase domain-containing protein [Candidatus Woesearchaeota archaeon]|nr:nucleotidyltransferase domain-containing protein [Candidatus Woesearchaeota archaeon]